MTPLLNTAQYQALKTLIDNTPALAAFPNNSDGNFAVAQLLNLDHSPDFWVWRTRVAKAELTNATSVDGTTFTWVGNGFITRSAGEQAAWREMFDAAGTLNPSLPQVRQAFTDIFSGAGNAAANRTHLATVARRKASVVEELYATGTGSTGSPGTMATEGPISGQEVETARNL